MSLTDAIVGNLTTSVDSENEAPSSPIERGRSALMMLYDAMNKPYCSSSDARCILAAMAENIGFEIHDVPSDGDCLFSAVVFQLPSIGLQPMSAQQLRANVVDYLKENPTIEYTFLISSQSPFLAMILTMQTQNNLLIMTMLCQRLKIQLQGLNFVGKDTLIG